MAGSNPSFDAAAFRGAIHFVQEMAASPDPDQQAVFYGPSTLVYAADGDDDRVFDPASTVRRQPAVGIRVPCSIEYRDADGEAVVFGQVTASRVSITLLDEDHAKVKDATSVVIAGDRYLYRRTEPPSGLFDVGIFVMTFAAENET